jgi:hypothetical protein
MIDEGNGRGLIIIFKTEDTLIRNIQGGKTWWTGSQACGFEFSTPMLSLNRHGNFPELSWNFGE